MSFSPASLLSEFKKSASIHLGANLSTYDTRVVSFLSQCTWGIGGTLGAELTA